MDANYFLGIFLKQTFYAHSQLHNFILGYYLNRFTCFNAQKHISILILSSTAELYSPSSLKQFQLPSLQRSPPEYLVCYDWSAHICLS